MKTRLGALIFLLILLVCTRRRSFQIHSEQFSSKLVVAFSLCNAK